MTIQELLRAEKPAGQQVMNALTSEALDMLLLDSPSVELCSAAARSENLSQQQMILLAEHPNTHVRAIIAAQTSLNRDALSLLAVDSSHEVRRMVAERDDTPIPVLETLSQDDHAEVRHSAEKALYPRLSQGVADWSERHGDWVVKALWDLDIPPQALAGAGSSEQIVKAIFGTTHPQEVRTAESFCVVSMTNGLKALTNLQIAFFNPRKQKLDRHRYLEFLKVHNALMSPSWLSALEGRQIRHFLDEYGIEGLLRTALGNVPTNAADVVRMVWALTGSEDAPNPERDKQHIALWLGRHNTYGKPFHDYLARKEHRTSVSDQPQSSFPQAENLEAVAGWEATNPGFAVRLPKTPEELRALGRDQHHCVGGAHYRKLLEAGQCYIFAIYPVVDGKRARGAASTFQFDLRGKLMHAEGFANSEVNQALLSAGSSVIEALVPSFMPPHIGAP
jgi:hypothetical protein